MPNLYVIGQMTIQGLTIDPISFTQPLNQVPSINQPIITIPESQIKPLYQNITQYLNQNNAESKTPHLGYRHNHRTFELMSYLQTNPNFTDYHLKNIDKLSKRTNQQPQVDDFIISNRQQLQNLQTALQPYLEK